MAQNEDRNAGDHSTASAKAAIGQLTGDGRTVAQGQRERREVKPKGGGKCKRSAAELR